MTLLVQYIQTPLIFSNWVSQSVTWMYCNLFYQSLSWWAVWLTSSFCYWNKYPFIHKYLLYIKWNYIYIIFICTSTYENICVGLISECKRMPILSNIFCDIFLTILLVNQEMTSVLKYAEYFQHIYRYIFIYLYVFNIKVFICIFNIYYSICRHSM